jgi:hypothetical protein
MGKSVETRLTELETKMIDRLKIKEIEWLEPGQFAVRALNRLVKKGYAERVPTASFNFGSFKWRLKI